MPEGTHPLPPPYNPDPELTGYMEKGQRGWESLPFVDLDGQNWPLDFAAKLLDIPVRDLADLVRITGLRPAGTIRMASYRRQGRQPRAFEAAKLIRITEMIAKLSEELASSA